MANISDIIEQFILKTMGDDNHVDISRNDLASFFSCVPSQINYVLETRFTLDRGFCKESRRGGGGYIRITRLPESDDNYLNSLIFESVGEELTQKRLTQITDKLTHDNIISAKEQAIIVSALSDKSLEMPLSIKDKVRANSFKNVLAILFKEKEN